MPALVLVVEDDPTMLELFAAIVRRGHYRVLKAKNGMTAIDLLQQERPDLVLLDLRLPGVDGLGVLDFIRGTPGLQKTKVVIITAHNDLAREVAKRDVDDIVIKPTRMDELLQIIRNLIG